MCRIHVLYCPGCQFASPIPTLDPSEETRRSPYYLVSDQRCKNYYCLWHEEAVHTPWVPAFWQMAKWPSCFCGHPTCSAGPAQCGVVPVIRPCCRRPRSSPLLAAANDHRIVRKRDQSWQRPFYSLAWAEREAGRSADALCQRQMAGGTASGGGFLLSPLPNGRIGAEGRAAPGEKA